MENWKVNFKYVVGLYSGFAVNPFLYYSLLAIRSHKAPLWALCDMWHAMSLRGFMGRYAT
ncbi:hypothetical protein HanIR_Chr16g0796381 [Helianthus annuus]|nr:hypothetical protein HanIR_Chr16g0796381 [Helianthus annuus]